MSNLNATGTTGYNRYDLLFVRSNLVGVVLEGISYGMVLVLYVRCMHTLWSQKKTRKLRYANLFMCHSTVVFILNTLYTAGSSRVLELTFVDNDDFPGGPLAYLNVEYSIPINILASVVFLIANWLLDALLLWRCAVIWSGPYLKYAMIFPSMILIGSFISGTLLLIVTCQPTSSLWSHAGVSVALPYYILSLSLNIVLTSMIVFRLLLHRRKMHAVLGGASEPYTSLAAFIVESAAPYAALSLLYLILVIINNPAQQLFLGLLSGAQIIASYLIILRVASGTAWSNNTSNSVSNTSIAFNRIGIRHETEVSVEMTETFGFQSSNGDFTAATKSQISKKSGHSLSSTDTV